MPENLDKVMNKVVEQGFAHQPQVGTDLELDLSCNEDMVMESILLDAFVYASQLSNHYETFASCHFSKCRSIK